jgi:two-component system, chemotaxis family, sensor kinase CheA
VSSTLPADDGFLRPEELAEIRRTFFDQARDALETVGRDVLALEGAVAGRARMESLRRAAHTFKGDCASVGFRALSRLAHAMEDAFVAVEGSRRAVAAGEVDILLAAVDTLRDGLEIAAKGRPEPDVEPLVRRLRVIGGKRSKARPGRAAVDKASAVAAETAALVTGDAGHDGETVRIEAERVDEVLTLVGELVTVRSILAGVGSEAERHLPEELAGRLTDAQSLLARVLQDLQRSTMRMRMVPAERVFRRFARAVRDLGRQTGKRIALRVEGESTELDRGILDALEEPLLHLVRNAVTHGIESASERASKGKPEEARLSVRAGREGNQILIEVADDGRGIDASAVRRRAVEAGFLRADEAEVLPEAEVMQLIFRSGLSTAASITEHAGRGVGLDVVRTTVESLRGSVTAENAPSGGALFRIRVPLTIAIIQALLFRAGGRQLAVPLSSVVEIAQVSDVVVQRVGTGEVVRIREQVLGLVRLGALLGLGGPLTNRGYVMVLQCGAGRFGVLADEMCGQEELVIKRVHDRWIRTPLVAGASIVAGGVPTLILDVLSIYRSAAAALQGITDHD